MCACVGCCVRLPGVLPPLVSHRKVCPPSRRLVSPCHPLFPLMCGALAFPRSCLPLPPLVAHRLPHVCLCWGLAPPYLPFFPTCVPVLVHLPEVLLPPVSHFLPTCVPVVDGCLSLPLHRWCIRFPEVLPPLVSQCLPTCEFVLDACLSWSPHRCACVGWCVRLPEVCLPVSPIVSLHVCWVLDGVSAFPRSCLPLSPLVLHRLPHVCLC